MRKKTNVVDIYPLSPMQQGMLFHTLYDPASGLYVEQFVQELQLNQGFDPAIFIQAWQQVLERHPILRTAFSWEQRERPLQVVLQRVKLPFEQLDWRDRDPATQSQQLDDWLEADRIRSFDLAKPPLLRLTLIHVSDDRVQCVWTYHHLLLDAWSARLVYQEVLTLYEALRAGNVPDLPLPPPYRSYITWLQEQDMAKAESFWRKELHALRRPTMIGGTWPAADGAASETDYGTQKLLLGPSMTRALLAFARQHHLTVNTLLQGGWALVLNRYSGEAEVLFGVTVSGRPIALEAADQMIGLFINSLPLRIGLTAGSAVLPWLRELQAKQLEVRRYEYTPLFHIQSWSEMSRGTPLFESILVSENVPVDDPQSWPVQPQQREDYLFKNNYPLTVTTTIEASRELALRMAYDRRHFDDATIARLLKHFQAALEGMIAAPDAPLAGISLLSDDDRALLLGGASRSAAAQAAPLACLHELFEAQAARTPHALALVQGTEDQAVATQQMTYHELNERANQIAHLLQSLGVGPETAVGVYLERSPDLIVALLGVIKAGAAYLPIDPVYPPERLAFMLDDARAPVLLTQQRLLDALPASISSRFGIVEQSRVVPQDVQPMALCTDRDAALIAAQPTTNASSKAGPDNLAYIMYTSGSTGRPKGAQISHANVARLLSMTQPWFRFDARDVWTFFHSYAFDFSVWEIWGALLHGGKLVIVPHVVSRSPEAFYDLLCREQVTVLNQTPSAFSQLVQAEAHVGPRADLQLRLVIFGGEALDPQSLRPWFAQHGDQTPQLVNMYGITETTVHVTYRPLVSHDTEGAPGSLIGGPIPDLELYVLDPAQQLVPVGVAGELYVGGAGVARGYLNRPALTAERFVPHPFAWCMPKGHPGMAPATGHPCPEGTRGARLYRTGDLARRLPNGDIEYLGRIDQQVKIRGFRIELGEIEAVLRQHAGIAAAAVLAHEVAPGDTRLVGYIVPTAGAAGAASAPGADELRSFLKRHLPEYMVVSAFVTLDQLPLTANGKLDRQALPVPDAIRPALQVAYVSPRTPVEEQIAQIWSQVLSVDRIGVHDHFFDLGGHSVLAIRLASLVREQFGVQISLRELFEAPTIAELSTVIAQHQAKQTDDEELARLLAELEQLSDDDAKHLLPNNA
jgi:amino acid adenylation domain-containing protein